MQTVYGNAQPCVLKPGSVCEMKLYSGNEGGVKAASMPSMFGHCGVQPEHHSIHAQHVQTAWGVQPECRSSQPCAQAQHISMNAAVCPPLSPASQDMLPVPLAAAFPLACTHTPPFLVLLLVLGCQSRWRSETHRPQLLHT